MATNSVQVGDIVVRLIADAKQLEKGLQDAGVKLDTFGKKGKQVGKDLETSFAGTARFANQLVGRLAALAAAFVSVNAVIGAFQREIALVTQLDHLSQITGVSIERLSQLRGVALQLGVDFELVGRTLSQFGGRMTEALASPVSKGSQALRALGIDARDAQGNIRPLDELLPQIAERFAGWADGANKAAIASALFGEEAGPRLIPLLNRGREGIEALMRAVRGTVTAEDAQRVRDYQQTVARLQLAFEEFFRELTRAAGPTLISIFNQLTRALEGMRVPTTFRDEIRRNVDEASRLEQEYERVFNTLMAMLRGPDEAVRSRPFWGMFSSRDPTPEDVIANLNRIKQAIDELIERRRVLERAAVGEFTTTVIPHRPEAPPMDPFALEKAQFALERLMDRLSGTRSIFDSINLSWEEHSRIVQAAIEQIDRTHAQAHQRQQARYRLERQLQQQQQQAMLTVAQTMAQTITMLWPKSKGAAIASAIINTSVGITKALAELPPPWSWIQAGLIAAQGAAQIANIRSTNEDGTGGTAATPAAPVAAEGAPMGRSLTISGIDPASIFSGGQVRGLIDQINDEVRNGATLISTGTLPL